VHKFYSLGVIPVFVKFILDDTKIVLDATAIRSGMMLSGEFQWFITPSVREEVSRGKQSRDLDLLSDISVKIVEPSSSNVGRVKKAAERTGDIGRLSTTDMDILALALDIDGIILTDDYSVQNLAKHLGIDHRAGVEKGIKKEFEWHWRCRGCGRYFDEEKVDCPICGSELRSVRKK